jgi:hypothetical protein
MPASSDQPAAPPADLPTPDAAASDAAPSDAALDSTASAPAASETAPSDPAPSDPAASDAPVKAPRRRGRTSVLIACAAALGILVGGGTGYAIQAGRPATPLPKLGQPGLTLPSYADPGPYATAKGDDLTTTSGDLRKLLLPRPAGTKDDSVHTEAIGGWVTVGDFAAQYDDPGDEFGTLLSHDFERQALVQWWDQRTETETEIKLIQFRDDDQTGAADYLSEEKDGVGSDATHSWSISGTVDGSGYADKTQYLYGIPNYEDRGLARHGDIVVYVFVNSLRKIQPSTVNHLVQSQLERL